MYINWNNKNSSIKNAPRNDLSQQRKESTEHEKESQF